MVHEMATKRHFRGRSIPRTYFLNQRCGRVTPGGSIQQQVSISSLLCLPCVVSDRKTTKIYYYQRSKNQEGRVSSNRRLISVPGVEWKGQRTLLSGSPWEITLSKLQLVISIRQSSLLLFLTVPQGFGVSVLLQGDAANFMVRWLLRLRVGN